MFHQDDHARADCTGTGSERERPIDPLRSVSFERCWLIGKSRVDHRRQQDLVWIPCCA